MAVFGVHGKNPQTMDVDDHGIAETTASTAMDKSPLVKTTASTAMDKSPLVKITASTGFNSRNHGRPWTKVHGQVHGKS